MESSDLVLRFPRYYKELSFHPAQLRLTAGHAELVESLRALGLTVTGEAVGAAFQSLFPGGTVGVDQLRRERYLVEVHERLAVNAQVGRTILRFA